MALVLVVKTGDFAVIAGMLEVMGMTREAKVSELSMMASVLVVKAWTFAVMEFLLLAMTWDVAVKALVLVV